MASFNPRPRTGGDGWSKSQLRVELRFQSAPPHGGRHGVAGSRIGQTTFQSAPPHGGRLIGLDVLVADQEVSIRAPARGATRS